MADTTNAKYCANCSCVLLQPGEEAGSMRTARVEELLCQNHPLLDVELPAFRKIADDTRTTLEDLDSKIVQAQELLETLLSARQRAQSRLDDAKTLLHPMRAIPNELLIEIFGHCIPKTYRVNDLDALDPRGAPWLLTRVCRRWRELAINSPPLWTYLLLDFDKHVGCITRQQCTYKVGLFLERSRSIPIVVYLGCENSVMDHPVLFVLEASIPRWRHLEVDLPRSSLQCFSGNDFLTLRTLTLRDKDEEGWNVKVDVFKSASAPVLQTLEVAPDIPWRALEHVTLAWSRLASIEHFPVFDADGMKTLCALTNLEDLQVDLDLDDNYTPIREIVPLPNLRRLTILEGDNVPGRSKEFLSALTIPALSELTVVFLSLAPVIHFPTSPTSFENLTKLDIACIMHLHVENTRHLLNFFTLTRRVEWLRIDTPAMTPEFIDGLNLYKPADGQPVRLPCLRFLDIGQSGFADTVDNPIPFFMMLYSRCPAGGEETVRATASRHASDRQSATTVNDEAGTEFDARSQVDSDDHRRCLERVQIPRWLYLLMKQDPILMVALNVELECAYERH